MYRSGQVSGRSGMPGRASQDGAGGARRFRCNRSECERGRTVICGVWFVECLGSLTGGYGSGRLCDYPSAGWVCCHIVNSVSVRSRTKQCGMSGSREIVRSRQARQSAAVGCGGLICSALRLRERPSAGCGLSSPFQRAFLLLRSLYIDALFIKYEKRCTAFPAGSLVPPCRAVTKE